MILFLLYTRVIQLIGITKPHKCVLDNKVKLERTKKKEFCKNENKSLPTSELFQSGIASGHSGASDKQTVLNKHTLSGNFLPNNQGCTRGQTISKANYGALNSSRKQTKPIILSKEDGNL